MRAGNRTVRRRPGFTLIEILVVIAIIGVLVSLITAASFKLIGLTQGNNTKSELNRLEVEMQKQYRAAEIKIQTEPIPNTGPYNAAYNYVLQTMANGDPNLARVIWVKMRLKQTFPNNFNEALNPAPLPALPYYKDQLNLLGYPSGPTQPWESSACLLMALGRAEDGGNATPEVLGVASSIKDFGPTPNGKTIKGLIDGWGNPLVFSRWPVNSTMLNPPNGQPQAKSNNDPGDPSGLLESSQWQGSAGYTLFVGTYGHALGQPASGGKSATSYSVFPVIASSGPDGQLGLNPITFAVTNAGQAADDLYPTLAPPQ